MLKPSLIGFLLLCNAIVSASPAIAEATKYRIGVLAPLTGNFASYGAIINEAVKKVSHPQIEWVFEDEACEPARAISGFKKLTELEGISFVIGPCCGSSQKAIAPLLQNRKSLALSPNAAPASVYNSSGQRMYSVQYSNDTEGHFLAEQFNKRGLKNVAIVYVDNDFSQTIDAAFRQKFQGTVVTTIRAPSFDASHMRSAALKLKALNFDSIFVPDAAPMLLGFLSELAKIGVPRRITFSVYSAQMQDVITAEKSHAEGLLYSYTDVGDSVDAFGYFPNLAARILSDAVAICEGAIDCVAKSFASDPRFNSQGVLTGELILKTIKHGKFERIQSIESSMQVPEN